MDREQTVSRAETSHHGSQSAPLSFFTPCSINKDRRTFVTTRMKTTSSFIWLVLLGTSSPRSIQALPKTPFLEDFLRGRCYDKPITVDKDPYRCPPLVNSFLGSFAGKLDKDVKPESFHSYIELVDFSSPPDKGLLTVAEEDFSIQGLVRPQDTAGGALAKGLTFRAENTKDDCPVVQSGSGTQWAFWTAVYQEFAKQLQGRLVIVVWETENYKDALLPVVRAVIPYLRNVSHVEMYLVDGTCETSNTVHDLRTTLELAGISKVSCAEDRNLVQLALCTGKLATPKSCQLAHQVVAEGRI